MNRDKIPKKEGKYVIWRFVKSVKNRLIFYEQKGKNSGILGKKRSKTGKIWILLGIIHKKSKMELLDKRRVGAYNNYKRVTIVTKEIQFWKKQPGL